MKIGLILFLAKYYHRISSGDVNRAKFLLSPIFALSAPVILVLTQPDLGTAFLIAAGGARRGCQAPCPLRTALSDARRPAGRDRAQRRLRLAVSGLGSEKNEPCSTGQIALLHSRVHRR